MTTSNDYQGPLTGLNVIDFGWYYAGSMAGMLLADQGANVIRIVKPGEKELPEQQYRLLNRNKKLLELDLKTEAGKTQALSLIEHADVVIENFRPGVMKRLDLDYASVKDKNPGLVYLSLPGFASTDKNRAFIQAWEGILAAASGMYVDVSYVRKLLNFPPLYHSLPVNSIFGAVHGVVAVMAALLAREKDGVGTLIETPLVDAGMSGFVHRFYMSRILGNHTEPFMKLRDPDSPTDKELWQEQAENWYLEEDSPQEQSSKLFKAMQAFWNPLYRYYRCADGRQVKLACMGSALRNKRLLMALEIYGQLLNEGFVNIPPQEAGGKVLNNNIADYPSMSDERKQRLGKLIAEAFLTRTSDEWDALLGTILPFSKVRTRGEYLSLKPMLDSGILTEMDNGNSRLTVPGRFVDVSDLGNALLEGFREMESISAKHATRLFKNNRLKKGAEPQARHSAAPKKKGDLLQGLKVLDLGTWVAGPMSSYVLAQYGAEVIKVDLPSTVGSPGAVHYGLGKRSLLADLRTAPGQKILSQLVNRADLVVHNKIDPVAERLGITREQLQATNPQVIVAQVSAFGGPQRGFWEGRFGLDPIPQAVTGLMAHYGTEDQPHDFEGTMIADALAGFGLAFGSLLGIWQQRRSGYAGEVRTSLIRAGNFFQLPYMIAESGRCNWGETRGQSALGEHWWQRLYQCKDGWIYVHSTENQANVLANTVTESGYKNIAEMESAFIEQDCDYWLSQLESKHIACHRVLGIDDICNRNMRRVNNESAEEIALGAGEVIYWDNPPSGHPVVLQAMDWVRIGENHSWKRVIPTPLNGEHSRTILSELGYCDADIEHLVELGVVA